MMTGRVSSNLWNLNNALEICQQDSDLTDLIGSQTQHCISVKIHFECKA